MPNEKELRDLDEMIPGNNLCDIAGSDREERNIDGWWEYEQSEMELFNEHFTEAFPEEMITNAY